MKIINLFAILLLIASVGFGQEIPSGVKYKKATDEVNTLAKTLTQNALSSTASLPTDFFGSVFVMGPTLWKALKPEADRNLIGAKPVFMVIAGARPFATEGKAIRTEDEKKSFWKQFKNHYKDLANARIRTAKANEISYYWATIPFDIEEPFWVIEAGNNRFIANFQLQDGKPRLFWIDLVGDLQKLGPE